MSKVRVMVECTNAFSGEIEVMVLKKNGKSICMRNQCSQDGHTLVDHPVTKGTPISISDLPETFKFMIERIYNNDLENYQVKRILIEPVK